MMAAAMPEELSFGSTFCLSDMRGFITLGTINWDSVSETILVSFHSFIAIASIALFCDEEVSELFTRSGEPRSRNSSK